ncbi:sigma-70 family RNA polymerase sigma factor [bacterium]|jgi:DNA-directed RNA polymerase specialized sigma24 family protein|nr:sigma-70 family RNA polymerase sigma factor [bacterium]
MNRNYSGLFENWEIAVATKVIKRYQNDGTSLRYESFEDLLQECLIQWFYSRDKYDSERGALKTTYMSRIVTNKLHDISRKRSTDKRKILHESYSLDHLSGDEDSESEVDGLFADTDTVIQTDLKITLTETYSQLTADQQRLCALMRDGYSNITELSEIMGIGRATVYREKERIKNVFEKEGLKDFLK